MRRILIACVIGAAALASGGVIVTGGQLPRGETAQAEPLPPPLGPTPAPEPTPSPSPSYPPLPEGSGSGRRVVYGNGAQRVWLVEDGERVVGSWLVSGRHGTPRPGHYAVFSRSRHTTANNGRWRMEFMVRFARGRTLHIGFHSIPVDRNGRPVQDESELGQPRSRGCVRQRYADASAMWDFAQMDTKVVVTR